MSDSLIPSSITGKGSHFPPGGSVLDHAFGASDPYTLGVEEEYMLLDAETFDLVQHIDTVLAAVAGHELEPRINSELMQSVLEVATPVCHTPAGVRQQLLRIRRYVTDVAREKGLRVGSAGTHPFSLFEAQRITAKDRYRALVDQMQYIARRELIFGMHVHVAVDDPEKAIQVVNALIAHLPELVALSASSPFWRGEPTGLRSSRHMVFAAFPRSGPPPRFRDYADYAQVVNQLEKTGCIQDYTHIWWDIRLHPRLGTIEIRICDAVTRLEDVIAITAYCQALVKHYAELVERGEEIPSFHRILTTENKWLAARYGLSAPVMDLHTGRRNRLPVAALVRRTMKTLRPHARDLGSEEELAGIDEILRRGNGADRQLHVFNSNRTSSRSRGRSRMPPRSRRSPSRRRRVGSSTCWKSARRLRSRRSSGRRRASARASATCSTSGRCCSSSISSTGLRSERTSSSSCVTGERSCRKPGSSRSRSRATRRTRTSPGCRRSTSTSRCSRTGMPRRPTASASPTSTTGCETSRAAARSSSTWTASSAAPGLTSRASCPTSTC